MALKALLDSLEGVDASLHTLYKKTDDGFVLDVDGEGLNAKLTEFRTNNRTLKKQVDDKDTILAGLAQFKDMDPEEVKEAMELRQRFSQDEEGKLLKEGKVDEVFARRSQRMKTEYETQLKLMKEQSGQLNTQLGTYKSKLEKLVLDVAITNAVNKAAVVKKSAMADVLSRARGVFSINENAEIIAVGPDGTKSFAKDGETPLAVDEWIAGLIKDADHLFDPASGGGAAGNKGANEHRGNQPAVVPNDPVAMGRRLKDIASGKAVVAKS